MVHPERLGKYQITGVLGEGAMGVVYRGFDPDIRRVVALKTIRQQGGLGAEAQAQAAARFRNEAQAAGRLLHPGIVGVYDFGESADATGRVAYIAMEYVEGHTLSAYLQNRVRFTEHDLASIACQLLEALGHAHEHGVWHRDVKPSNVIMTKVGKVKIADFGIARTDNSGLTMANSVLGTPMYMAPEQFMGHAIDHKVDLYGAGVVLYQLIAGRPPFTGAPESLMYKVVHEIPVPPSSVEGPQRVRAFDEVILRALHKDPRDRWRTASAFRDAVAQALAAHAGGSAGSTVPGAVSHETVNALPSVDQYASTERIVTPGTARAAPPPAGTGAAPSLPGAGTYPRMLDTGSAPTFWDPSVLAKVEQQLVRHVGPLAAVMVRRAARRAADLPALYLELGQQITSSSAREAFLSSLSATSGAAAGGTPGTGGSIGTGGSFGAAGRSLGGGAGAAAAGGATNTGFAPGTYVSEAPVSDAWLEQAGKLLAAHLGPIASVMVKRAAARSRQRGAMCAALVEAVPEAARARLLSDLGKLP